MKVNILEAHDRLKYFVNDQSANVFQGAEECMLRNPISLGIQEKCPYVYIFAHPRTANDGVNKRLLWQPRLSIPEVQPNSYLFRGVSHSDIIEIIWILPAQELWEQYEKGNVTESNLAASSIAQYRQDKRVLEKPHPDDLPEERARLILQQVYEEYLYKEKMKKILSLV
jgi:hypothetical protein